MGGLPAKGILEEKQQRHFWRQYSEGVESIDAGARQSEFESWWHDLRQKYPQSLGTLIPSPVKYRS